MPHPYEWPTPDYRIDGLKPATERIEDDFDSVTLSDDMFVTLAAHHSADGRDSYLLLYDRSAIWDIPGTAEYVTLHLIRDVERQTFTFEHDRHPILPLAQNWLIRQGCPPAGTEPTDHHGPRPADAITVRLEDRLRTDLDDRYEVIDHYTDNPCSFDRGVEVYTVVCDNDPDSAQAPYRVFLQETTRDLRSYTMREGAFTTAEAACAWATERNSPLPTAPVPHVRRAQTARARSTLHGRGLSVPPAPVALPRPTTPASSHPRRGAL
ncbi:hypothetical protein [Streptomyces shenzhenensis]|uniref:hypothetical protein n=1 Tax=Streptomyces shenzhenensis TaxID=943815 RepID=UPI0033F550CF